jgi:hypothetical protein
MIESDAGVAIAGLFQTKRSDVLAGFTLAAYLIPATPRRWIARQPSIAAIKLSFWIPPNVLNGQNPVS